MRVVPGRSAPAHLTVAASTLIAAALVLSACSSSASKSPPSTTAAPATQPSTAAPTSLSVSPTVPTVTASPSSPVHVSLLEGDGGVYGVGMPVVAYFDRAVTDATAFAQATTVTVNGAAVQGAWFWEKSGRPGQALEAHYRLQQYWPAHATIKVALPVKGLSAGTGLAYDDSLTLAISTGPANVSTVDCSAEKMTVTSDGKPVRTLPTSCGKATTPTYTGVKVLMQKGEDVPGTNTLRPTGAVRMVGTDPAEPYDLMVPWSMRLTNSGEYAHAAAWNGGNIGSRSTSNGCTNLNVADAQWLYNFSQVGDVLDYTNTGGQGMPSWDGYGDWNVAWSTWQAGGAVTTSG
jgi:lipoprotein-anchoring transpeptidase ErfK/SrfK